MEMGGIKRLVSNRDLRCVYVGQISASAHTSIVRKIFHLVRHVMAVNRCAEISFQNIGAGFHLSHGNAIILTAKARIGEKCSLRNGITIGVEMCGKRKGAPTKRNVYIESLKKVKAGNGVLINHGVHLYIGLNNDSQITIGNNVAIGLDSIITTNSHIIGNREKRWRTNTGKSVVIEDGVWIGANVTILPGVTIGGGGKIATGAVVTSSTEANAVYAGVPAKKIKKLEE